MYRFLSLLPGISLAAHCVTEVEVLRPVKDVLLFRWFLLLPLWVIQHINWVPVWDRFYYRAETNLIYGASKNAMRKICWMYNHDPVIMRNGWACDPGWFVTGNTYTSYDMYTLDEDGETVYDTVPVIFSKDAYFSWYAQQ